MNSAGLGHQKILRDKQVIQQTVENVAYAIALAVNEEKAKGWIYNVAELPGSTEADLVKAIVMKH